MKKLILISSFSAWAGLWLWVCLAGITPDLAPAAETASSKPAGVSTPATPENLTGAVKTGNWRFSSRAQVEEAMVQTRNQISGIGQELVVLETYLYLMRDGLMKEKRVGALAQIRWGYEYNSIIDIQEVQIRLDDEPVLDRKDEGDRIDHQKEMDLYRSAVVPGEHRVTALIKVRGRKRGLFSYFQKYQMELKLTQDLYFPEGKISVLTISLLDQGGRFEISERFKVGLKLETEEVGSR